MSIIETQYEHIVLNEKGIPVISGTNFKITELVLEKTAYGWSSEELHFQHPDLTLGQIYSALAYYWDHQEEIDDDIKKRLKQSDEFRNTFKTPSIMSKLKSKS